MAVVAAIVLYFSAPSPESLAFGLMLGLLGESLRFWSIGYSGGHTRGLAVEAPFLATGGPYARTRNPLYLGNVLNSLGVAVAAVGQCKLRLALILLTLATGSLGLVYGSIIPLEESFLSFAYGTQYELYCAEVPRFFPRIRPWPGGEGKFSLDSALYFERWSLAWWSLTWVWLAWRVGSPILSNGVERLCMFF